MNKKWYASKTIWVNIIGVISIIFNDKISPEIQAYALAAINFILRWITKEEIKW